MKKAIDRRQFGIGGATAAALAAGSRARAQSGPLKFGIGWVVVPASRKPRGSKARLPLLRRSRRANSTLDRWRFSSFGLAIQNAHMDDLRVICDEIQDGVAGHGTNEFMVRNDSPIKTVADLKGKVLATNAMGSAVDIAMRAMLRRSGLEANRDYTVVEAPFPAMRAMLAERKADLISAVPPFSLDPDLRAMAHTLFTQRDAFGITQLTMWTARENFIQKNGAALIDFLEDTVRAIRWYLDPKNHDEAVAIVARLNKAPPARMDWAFTSRDQYRDPNGTPNLGRCKTISNNRKKSASSRTTSTSRNIPTSAWSRKRRSGSHEIGV